MQTAWIRDRTVWHSASAKPAIVRQMGSSRYLPNDERIFRFKDLAEAKGCFEKVASAYDAQCLAARPLAEEYFDSWKVVGNVLNQALA